MLAAPIAFAARCLFRGALSVLRCHEKRVRAESGPGHAGLLLCVCGCIGGAKAAPW
ncbi:hypothetical protein CGMCC3_g10908 [Colletotrichum fructicola]|nr:uncharacterized protein CGMCC3_g10908 [Colletotrichum fructicola]KAE9573018.1 hypothetical protein CGMCC3_g10908 [Colletotrichum fructicola]